MKRPYIIPDIRLQSIDADDLMEISLPIFNGENPDTKESDIITDQAEILSNSGSVWEE